MGRRREEPRAVPQVVRRIHSVPPEACGHVRVSVGEEAEQWCSQCPGAPVPAVGQWWHFTWNAWTLRPLCERCRVLGWLRPYLREQRRGYVPVGKPGEGRWQVAGRLR